MNKTLLLILPIAAMTLVGCNGGRGGRGGRGDTTTVNPTTQGGGGGGGDTPVTPSTPSTPSGGGSTGSFDTTPGEHTVTLDFVNDYEALKDGFPYVEASTGVYDGTLNGLSIKGRGCFVSSYNSLGYLMMKNKDMDGNPAFIASQASLGNITSISVTHPSASSTSAVYKVAITDSPLSDLADSWQGEFSGNTGTHTTTGSGSYFCIASTDTGKNGQLATFTITYTIE